MIIRVQSPSLGTYRINIPARCTAAHLYEEVFNTLKLDSAHLYQLYRKRGKQALINKTELKLNFSEGEMIFLPDVEETNASNNNYRSSNLSNAVPLDEIDFILEKLDGRIIRKFDPQLCRHREQARCVHCLPKDPWDADPAPKFLSFHAWLRKLSSGVDKGKFTQLSYPNCKVLPNCGDHPPWPAGICTKCQPAAITLTRQPYRHVDYVSFENPSIVDRFLSGWRSSGKQRMGILYGRYEQHKDVPLGIKAVVAAIYEPPQSSNPQSLSFSLDLLESPSCKQIIRSLGLAPVGWVFTDLQSDGNGKVKCIRGKDSFFLSAEECITAAALQLRFPNPCRRAAEDGNFGSKFVTVCMTGDSDGSIHSEAYQISNQACALVRHDCLIPTVDAAQLGYVPESTALKCVPDVFYKLTDEYKNEQTVIARPLPVEYLLIDVPVGFPLDPEYTFTATDTEFAFPPANRSSPQDWQALCRHFECHNDPAVAIKDLHVLIYLAEQQVCPLGDSLELLLRAFPYHDEIISLLSDEPWQTIQHCLTDKGTTSTEDVWKCSHCTFDNVATTNTCEMCSLPRFS